MPRPGYMEWATNANHAAGADPWSGQPNKVEPAAGKIATGRIPEEPPPAEEYNWLTWAAALLLTSCGSLRTVNWLETDVTGLAAATGRVDVGSYDPARDTHWVLADDNPALIEQYEALGGLIWAPVVPALFAGWQALDCDTSDTGDRVAVFAGGNDRVYADTVAAPAWALWAGGFPAATQYNRVHHDQAGRWTFADSNSVLYTSTAPAVVIAAMTTPPGFAAAAPITIRHSHHPAALIHPSDPGNPVWMVLTPTEISTSANGVDWTAAAAHGIAAPATNRNSLAYSAYGAKWIVGTLVAGTPLVVSTDNGTSWAAGPTLGSTGVPANIEITCDNFGHWVIVTTNATPLTEVWASVDNGITWSQIHQPTALQQFHALWFGGGRFNLATSDAVGVGTYDFTTSLRMSDE